METTQTDPYNYPFLKKDETMYLSTICKCIEMQLKMTLSLRMANTIDNHHSKKKILKGQHPKF
jgi:hypothetical protein